MIKNVFLKNLLINTVFKVFSGANAVLGKDDKKILLYSDTTFRDNTRYLYDYLIDNGYNERYKIICACKDYQAFSDCRIKNVSFVRPRDAVMQYFTSGHVFYSFGKLPITPSKNQTVIQMWHGTSFKGFSSNQKQSVSKANQFYSYVYASSEYFREIVARKFAVEDDRVVICGHPRTDTLYKDGPDYDFGSYEKVITWLPTFRKSSVLGMQDGKQDSVVPLVGDDELSALDQYLQTKNVKLIVKLHPEQDVSHLNSIEFSHLNLMTDAEFKAKNYDLYALLRCSDALITDYSSVFYDYLLLNRPIGFTEDDVEEYRDSRGFAVDDPDAFRPGMKMRTMQELEQFIDDVLLGNDAYEKDRKKINDLSNQYQDGQNCRRSLEISGIK